MNKILIFTGPSFKKNSGYRVRVNRITSHYSSNNVNHEVYCVDSFRTFIKGFLKTFDKQNKIILLENIGLVLTVLLNPIVYNKCVLDYHGSIYDASFRKDFLIRKQVYLFFEKVAVRFFKKIIVVSNAFKSKLVLDYKYWNVKPKILVIKNIPQIETLNLLVPDPHHKDINQLRLAYVGNNQTWQKIPELFDFIEKLNAVTSKKVKLTIATNEKKWFYDYINVNNVSFDTSVIHVTKEKLLQFLNLQDFLLMLRDEDEINRVACPTKAIEYLLSYTPILVSKNLGDISDYVKHNNKGVILGYPWGCKENLNAILDFLKNYNRRPGLEKLLDQSDYNKILDL